MGIIRKKENRSKKKKRKDLSTRTDETGKCRKLKYLKIFTLKYTLNPNPPSDPFLVPSCDSSGTFTDKKGGGTVWDPLF